MKKALAMHQRFSRTAFLLALLGWNAGIHAYEVWTTPCKMPRAVITTPAGSEITRLLAEGITLNFATFKADDGPFQIGEEAMRDQDWRIYFASMGNPAARRGIDEIPRTTVFHPDLPIVRPSLEAKLTEIFKPNSKGYEVGALMPYDNYYQENPANGAYNWTAAETKSVRTWLDTAQGGKFKSVKLTRNIRNFSGQKARIQAELDSGIIDTYVFEGNPLAFYTNFGLRKDMLDYFFDATDARLRAKGMVFQIPIENWDYPDEPNTSSYQRVRNFLVWLVDRYGYDALKGNRVKFLITTYTANYAFYPELEPGGSRKYANSILGLTLSLLEQKALFTGMLKNPDGTQRKPTTADAYSYTRTATTTSTGAWQPSRGTANSRWISSLSHGGLVSLPEVVSWSVVDLRGTTVQSGFGTVVDLRSLPKGLYLLRDHSAFGEPHSKASNGMTISSERVPSPRP